VVLGGEAGGAGKGEQGVAAVVAVVVAVGEPVGVVGPRQLGGEAQLHVGVDAGRVAGGEDGGWGRGGGGGGEQVGGQRGVGEGGREAGGRTLLQRQRVQQVVGHLETSAKWSWRQRQRQVMSFPCQSALSLPIQGVYDKVVPFECE